MYHNLISNNLDVISIINTFKQCNMNIEILFIAKFSYESIPRRNDCKTSFNFLVFLISCVIHQLFYKEI